MQRTSTPQTPATRITKAFEQALKENRGVLIPYFMCGYPTAISKYKARTSRSRDGSGYHRTRFAF